MSKNEMNFYQKISQIQKDLKVSKNNYNAFGKYKYRSCEDILEGVKPLAAKHGLFVVINDEIKVVGDRYYVCATVTITDGENSAFSQAYAREENEKRGMDASQLTGATSSYARKYALNGLFCIDDTKDADSHDNSDKPAQQKAPPPKPKEMTKEQKTKKMVADIIKSLKDEPSAEFFEQALVDFEHNEFATIKEESENAYNYLMEQIKEIKAKFV